MAQTLDSVDQMLLALSLLIFVVLSVKIFYEVQKLKDKLTNVSEDLAALKNNARYTDLRLHNSTQAFISYVEESIVVSGNPIVIPNAYTKPTLNPPVAVFKEMRHVRIAKKNGVKELACVSVWECYGAKYCGEISWDKPTIGYKIVGSKESLFYDSLPVTWVPVKGTIVSSSLVREKIHYSI